MNINDIYEVVIDSVDSNGNGVCRIDNFVVFVPYALMNEKVTIKINEVSDRYSVGEIVFIIDKSDNRCEVSCPYYNKCGGCNFLHTLYSEEMDIKLSWLERLFGCKVNHLVNKNINNYRNKVTLHVLEGKLGYFNNKTHDLCEIDGCLLLNP